MTICCLLYTSLYAQAMALLRSNERYWFDEKEEAIMTEANREFEQSPVIEQLFQVYYLSLIHILSCITS